MTIAYLGGSITEGFINFSNLRIIFLVVAASCIEYKHKNYCCSIEAEGDEIDNISDVLSITPSNSRSNYFMGMKTLESNVFVSFPST